MLKTVLAAKNKKKKLLHPNPTKVTTSKHNKYRNNG